MRINKRPLLRSLFTFFIIITTNGLVASAQTKKVFAHYMVCFPSYDGTIEGYKKDIRVAQSVGIDGFALNCGVWNDSYKSNAAKMFQAALELHTGFKLFFSADQCSGLSDAAVVDMVKTYGRHPNQFIYKNKVFLSAWSGGRVTWRDQWVNNILPQLKKAGFNVYLVPFMYPVPITETPDYDLALKNYNQWWGSFLDGYFYFAAGGLPVYGAKYDLLKSGEALARVFHDNTRTFMASVSPQYWGAKQNGGRRYYDFKGGEGLAAQWRSILEVQKPEWVELVTWNDWEEFTYFDPLDDISKYTPYTTFPELGFHKTHKGFAELNKYYIQWYKKGKRPAIRTDQLFYFYRTYPKNIVATNDPLGPVTNISGDLKDEIYVTTLLRSPATLKVYSGDEETTFNLEKGVNNIRIPFHVGKQIFKLSRNDKELITAYGEDIKDGSKKYDLDMYSGSASAQGK